MIASPYVDGFQPVRNDFTSVLDGAQSETVMENREWA